MSIEKVLEMDDGKTMESRIRARHSGDQRMMDMLKVILIFFFNLQPTGVDENFLPLGWKTTMTYYQIVHLFSGFSFEPFLHLKSLAKSGRLASGTFALQGSGKWPSS